MEPSSVHEHTAEKAGNSTQKFALRQSFSAKKLPGDKPELKNPSFMSREGKKKNEDVRPDQKIGHPGGMAGWIIVSIGDHRSTIRTVLRVSQRRDDEKRRNWL
jgi:hypothetical protein